MHQVITRVEPAMDSGPTDLDICDAYIYLLGRLLILRQEQVDFRFEGFRWNQIHHREAGRVSLPDPDLDVARSEAWIAIDEHSCTMLHLPEIRGRYYTAQIINGWGETIANINDRTSPDHPSGQIALCLAGSRPPIPPGAARVDLSSRKSRCVVRIELGPDAGVAAALQHQIEVHAYGEPVIAPTVMTPLFGNDGLPGAGIFEQAEQILASEADLNPGMERVQRKVRAAAAVLRHDTDARGRTETAIERGAWPRLARRVSNLGIRGRGWIRPKLAGTYGEDWLSRTATHLSRPWSNELSEVVYFTTGTDQPLDGGRPYTLTFPSGDLPGSHVRYFWSMTALDAADQRVMPNGKHRFALTSHSGLQRSHDGSLTLCLGPARPAAVPDANWLPTLGGRHYLLTWRSYGPDALTRNGAWFPPSVDWPGVPRSAA
jgi:hypothetical protein